MKYNLDDGLAVTGLPVDVYCCGSVSGKVLAAMVSPMVCGGLDNDPGGMCWLHHFYRGCMLF